MNRMMMVITSEIIPYKWMNLNKNQKKKTSKTLAFTLGQVTENSQMYNSRKDRSKYINGSL